MKTVSIIFLYVAVGAVIIAGFILQRNVNRLSRIIKDAQCPKAGNTYEAWVAKDKSKAVYVFLKEPVRDVRGVFWETGHGHIRIPSDAFPDLTFENSPQKVRLTIEKV